MQFFRNYFKEVENWGGEEVKVTCPFHDDTHPSASINTEKGLFHCWVCDIGYTEEQFISRVLNVPLSQAINYKEKALSTFNIEWEVNFARLWSNDTYLKVLNEIGYSNEIINELKLGVCNVDNKEVLGVPVFYNGVVMDVRYMNIFKHPNMPKVQSAKGTEMGFIIPYDKWKSTEEDITYILEGEKDMLVAQSLGLNAITLTGGAGAKLNEYVLNEFKDKSVVICYDNDDAGRNGMQKLFMQLKDIVKSIGYIDIGKVVKNDKEDFTDYIQKYNGDVFGFISLPVEQFKETKRIEGNLKTLQTIIQEDKGTKETTVVSVIADVPEAYSVPTAIKLIGKSAGDPKSVLMQGEEMIWTLDMKRPTKLLELIECEAKTIQVQSKVKSWLGIPPKEPVDIAVLNKVPIYKCVMADINSDKGLPTTIEAYSFERLQLGHQYKVEHIVVPHSAFNQKLVSIVLSQEEIESTLDFAIDTTIMNKLRYNPNELIFAHLQELYESAKHHIAKHLDYNLWLMCELVFNSILEFDYDERLRGALDVFILGDTQTGKSSTTTKLTEMYRFGHFISLKTATTVGLIGGSTKIGGSYYNTIGAIPRQHKKLVVLEEFSGAKDDFIKTMTDVRSSTTLRITRAAGELRVPCMLRMITLSNPINDSQGNSRFLNTFPNGVAPLMELIKSAEDVARYDGFLLMPKVQKRINPFETETTSNVFPLEYYAHKAKWVQSRKPENVWFEQGVKSYIWEKAQQLNKRFECDFPLFATTTDKKLARFCVAMASLLVNTTDDFENIIVTKDIVDYTTEYLISIYDNDVFKLADYKKECDAYTEVTESDIVTLQAMYPNHSVFFEQLYKTSKDDKNSLRILSGLDNDKFSTLFNQLVRAKFIRIHGMAVMPTLKFKKAFHQIKRNFTIDDGTIIRKEDI